MYRLKRLIRNFPNLMRGYNLYVNPDKLKLIEQAFGVSAPLACSFADLGGVWKVHAAYSRHILRKYPIQRGVLVDTDFPAGLEESLGRLPNMSVIRGDFASDGVVSAVGQVDVVLLFDVLLHQANPHWDEVLRKYAKMSPCFVIYNQQWIRGPRSIRLVDLPIEEYTEATSDRRKEVYRQIYAMGNEINADYGKPWRDIHNITQWGITDQDLRDTMNSLGYREAYFKNIGRFLDLPAFENHAFIFLPVHALGKSATF